MDLFECVTIYALSHSDLHAHFLMKQPPSFAIEDLTATSIYLITNGLVTNINGRPSPRSTTIR